MPQSSPPTSLADVHINTNYTRLSARMCPPFAMTYRLDQARPQTFDLERAPFPEDVPVAFLCANASSRLFLSFWRSSCELLVCMCLHFSPYWHELVW